MKNIDEKIEKYLNEEYDEFTDQTDDVLDEFKELAKLFGGKLHNDLNSATLFPFKKGGGGLGDWDVDLDLRDTDPLEINITVHFYNRAMGMGGYISIEMDDMPDENVIKRIGKWQEKYYNTIEDILNDAKKIGKVARE